MSLGNISLEKLLFEATHSSHLNRDKTSSWRKKDYSHLFQFFLQVMNQPGTRELEKSKQNGKRWELSRKIFLEVKLLNDNNSPVGVFWPKKSRPTFSVRCLVENQRRWKTTPGQAG